MDIEKELFLLYYDTVPENIETLDLCRGDKDFRKVYITDDGNRKLVIKHASNAFTNAERIRGWQRLIAEYNKLGIYCPDIIPNKNGDVVYQYTENGRTFCVHAEEFAKFDIAESLENELKKDETGTPVYVYDMLRSLGKVSAAHFDFLPFGSAYCLLEPHSAPDTTDEATECAEQFFDFVKKELPEYCSRAEKLLDLFYKNQEELRKIYASLPVSCFQGDLGSNNVLINAQYGFEGLIDFNLCGMEPVLNYSVRAALWQIWEERLFDSSGRWLFLYDEELDKRRIDAFLRNLRCIEEFYNYSDEERKAFPVLFRYMNSFWWHHVSEIKLIKDDEAKIEQLFAWLELQMTRDDIRLP